MSHTEGYSRRRLLTLAAGVSAVFTFDRALATTTTPATTGGHAMQTRAIPSSAESLPIVGLGTYRGFDVAPVIRPTGNCRRCLMNCSPRAAR